MISVNKYSQTGFPVGNIKSPLSAYVQSRFKQAAQLVVYQLFMKGGIQMKTMNIREKIENILTTIFNLVKTKS